MHIDRVAAGLFLFHLEPSGPRWLLLRHSQRHDWGFPKGHQEAGETLYGTAVRECAEETGIASFAPIGPAVQLHYQLPNGLYKSVHYYPARTRHTHVVLSKEHDAFAWLNGEQVIEHLDHHNLGELFTLHYRQVLASDFPK